MKFQNLSVKRLFGRVAMELVLSMSGITIALFLVTKQIAVLLTGGALLLCAIVGIFVLTQAFGKRLSQFTTDLCQTLDHMIAGNEAPQRPEDSETQLARIGHRLARLYQIMQENRRRVDGNRLCYVDLLGSGWSLLKFLISVTDIRPAYSGFAKSLIEAGISRFCSFIICVLTINAPSCLVIGA